MTNERLILWDRKRQNDLRIIKMKKKKEERE